MILTVILRDDSPMIFCNSLPTYRSVQIELTKEQCLAIEPRHIGIDCGKDIFEEISQAFIEPNIIK